MFRFRSVLRNVSNAFKSVRQPPVSQVKTITPLTPQIPHYHGTSTKMVLGALTGGATLAAAAALSYDKRNIDLKALSGVRIGNLDELGRLEKDMVELAGSTANEEKRASVISWCKTINKAVTKGDANIFIEHLNKLASIPGAVTEEYLATLITTCANQGRVSLLRILNDNFELGDLITQNPLAKRLMAHPAANEIERLSNQFIQGVGNIKEEGTRLRLKQFEIDDTERVKESVSKPLITGLDGIEDTMLMLSYIESQDEARRDVAQQYQNVVVLELQEHDGAEGFVNYLETLKAVADKEGHPVDSIFILQGSHFTCGQVKVEKKGDKYEVKLFYLDSLGSGLGTFAGYDLVPDFEKVFPGQTKYIVSEVKEQHADKGCSVFSLMHVYDLIHLPETFEEHARQGGEKYADIFDYVGRHTTDTHKGIYADRDGELLEMTYDTALPPLAFSRAKQSMSKSGDESYTEPSGKTYKKKIVGYMGLPHEIDQSPPARQKEIDFVINAHIPTPLREAIAANIRSDARGKSQNLGTQLLIGDWGLNLTSWLTSQTPEQIKQHASAFGVSELATKHDISGPVIEELPDDSPKLA